MTSPTAIAAGALISAIILAPFFLAIPSIPGF